MPIAELPVPIVLGCASSFLYLLLEALTLGVRSRDEQQRNPGRPQRSCWDEDLFRPNKDLNSTYDLNVKSAYFFNARLSNLSNAIHDKLASLVKGVEKGGLFFNKNTCLNNKKPV